ncbi:hypothetical protein M0R04_14275 [Candidatus Dojkabacteria bacterium]|jgi:hypothetical protein|nr:hypothetical protein [Candidatus Dojkabacteria bacterium]
MKIMYISCHETLEHDELEIFTELGHDVFSYQGAYMYPDGHPSLKRPGIPNMQYHKDLAEESLKHAKTKIPTALFDWADTIIIMHDPAVVVENWDRMKHKPVIWRSIGQSTPVVEDMVRRMRYDGMKIVRMSPMEENIVGYLGSDAIIRFAKDKDEWKDWNGKEKRVINFTQSLKGRRIHCHYDSIMQVMNNFPALIFGSGNTDLGGLDGGELTYELMKGALRDNRVFVYGGTWPSPYTLAVQEAMMTGIPVVALGQKLAEELPEIPNSDRVKYYEMTNIIKNTENGFISDDIGELRAYVHELLNDETLAKRIGAEGRKTAIELWDKEKIKKQWEDFFKTL